MIRPLVLMTLLATPAAADEVWYTSMGDVVYEADTDGAAVFSFDNLDGTRALLVIPGLAGNFQNRGVHPAFWVGQGAGSCFAAMTASGQTGHQWGQALVSFDDPAYPTSFTLTLGDCFEPMNRSLRAEAR